MTNQIFQKIVKESQSILEGLAKKNGWSWFINMHQKEVIKYASRLLKIYKKADRKIVLISCWLHDIAHLYAKDGEEITMVKKDHHINSAKIAEQILKKYNIEEKEIDRIKNCILRHRNAGLHKARSLEEKVVAVADTLSHFGSIFYFTYFKFHPHRSLERMVKDDLAKLERDWRDLQLLPGARELVEAEYKVLKRLLGNYK
ncbi:MAG: HD domain-containing protein [Candidatus Portnoybacteria bacterium]|nr:HD domain-containing protein [Candidatus Portnoybacteria bacterium]